MNKGWQSVDAFATAPLTQALCLFRVVGENDPSVVWSKFITACLNGIWAPQYAYDGFWTIGGVFTAIVDPVTFGPYPMPGAVVWKIDRGPDSGGTIVTSIWFAESPEALYTLPGDRVS